MALIIHAGLWGGHVATSSVVHRKNVYFLDSTAANFVADLCPTLGLIDLVDQIGRDGGLQDSTFADHQRVSVLEGL